VLISLVSAGVYDRSRAISKINLGSLPTLTVSQGQRILIVAPHPDDETLGAGGLIQLALMKGAEVKIVIVTNGDGQLFAPLTLDRRFGLSARDFIIHGERREQETLSALSKLGVAKENVFFLGYPDGYLNRLWVWDWYMDCPIRTRWTRSTRSPYPATFDIASTYCGSDLAKDLREIFAAYSPDVVVLPHPNDDHPDHRAVANFTRWVLAMASVENPEYQPSLWAYLVHYGYYPQPRKKQLNAALLPPMPLSGENNEWYRLDLNNDQVIRKAEALEQYHSQIRLLRNFLPSFARQNEIFSRLSLLNLDPIGLGSLPLPEAGIQGLPLPEPANESAHRLIMKGADLVGWRIARLDNQLFLAIFTRGKLIPGLRYRILIKTPDGKTHILTPKSPEVSTHYNMLFTSLDLDDLGNPDVLGFAADVSQGAVIDRTGWNFVILRDWSP
jgi:LmbE family N-acetylglucosaminyl deacetylase